MTRKCDRIQENASRYVIRNCPCNVTTEDMCDWGNANETYCQDCTDCVIKQVINYCLEQNLKYDTTACEILQLFNIEEVK